VRRAADLLNVRKTRGAGGVWYWALPHLLTQVAQGAQHSNVEQAEQVGQAEPVQPVHSMPSEPDVEVY
jgi:hypothetical protein